MLLFSASIGTMNAPQCWQPRDYDACSEVGTSAKHWRLFKHSSAFEKADTSAAYPYGTMNFIPTFGI
jgi:hypothetical protein